MRDNELGKVKVTVMVRSRKAQSGETCRIIVDRKLWPKGIEINNSRKCYTIVVGI